MSGNEAWYCGKCGTENIHHDAIVSWDSKAQKPVDGIQSDPREGAQSVQYPRHRISDSVLSRRQCRPGPRGQRAPHP